MKKYVFGVLLVLLLVLSLAKMGMMTTVTVGPIDPEPWHKYETAFFSGKLHVESSEKFVIKTINGEIISKSHPVEVLGREGPLNVAEFNATASEFYRTNENVTVYSDIDTEIIYFWDPMSWGWFLP